MGSAPIDIRERTPYTVDQFRVTEAYEEDLEHVLISEGEIESRIDAMAADISRTYRERTGTETCAICVLKGAMRFFDALVPRLDLDTPLTEGLVRSSRYGAGVTQNQRATVEWLDPDLIAGRDVLIVEDIVDEGYTLETILDEIEPHDPNSVDLAVLFDKTARRQVDIDVEFTGFYIPDEFVVGYGLDYDERYRDLRHLATIDSSAIE